MRVTLSQTVSMLTGRAGPDGLVLFRRGERLCARAFVRPRQPDTPDQQEARRLLAEARKAWASLDTARRDGWMRYAARHLGPATGKVTGYALFVRAARYRLLLSLPPVADAPLAAPPPGVVSVAVLADADERTLRLQVTHGALDPAGLRLALRITHAMAGARRPDTRDLRSAAGLAGGASLAALPPSGAVAAWHGLRFALPPGARFALEATTVREADGIPAMALRAEVVRP